MISICYDDEEGETGTGKTKGKETYRLEGDKMIETSYVRQDESRLARIS